MTIFEMLELLETEIVALRARNQELRLALAHGEQTDGLPPAAKRRKGSPKKKSRKVAASGKRDAKKGEQLPLPAVEEKPNPEQEARSLGKRLALGKSLVQLRKVAAPRAL